MEKSSIAQQAVNAIRNYDRYNMKGSELDVSNASPYGIALKYILWNKRISFSSASKMIGYKSPQSFNYLLNRRAEKDFYEEELTYICKKLQINEKMFFDLSMEIKKLLVANEK